MMRVTVKGEPVLLGWRYTTHKKTLMKAECYAKGFIGDSNAVLPDS